MPESDSSNWNHSMLLIQKEIVVGLFLSKNNNLHVTEICQNPLCDLLPLFRFYLSRPRFVYTDALGTCRLNTIFKRFSHGTLIVGKSFSDEQRNSLGRTVQVVKYLEKRGHTVLA